MTDLSSSSSCVESCDKEIEFLTCISQHFNNLRRPYLVSTRIDPLIK